MGLSDATTKYSESLSECLAYAQIEGDSAVTRLTSGNPSPKIMELSKDLYTKWSTYMSSLSVYVREDGVAKHQYEAAKEALLTEDKFSK